MNYDYVTSVQIHLTGSARRKAAWALYSQKKLTFREMLAFTGPHFKGGVDVAIGHSTVNVCVDNGSVEYIYPLHSVGRIKIEA
jgi:hypothetical protein